MNAVIETHEATIAYSSDRVMGYNRKTGGMTKTIGWSTRCSCGESIKTNSNNKKAHEAKVARHLAKVGA